MMHNIIELLRHHLLHSCSQPMQSVLWMLLTQCHSPYCWMFSLFLNLLMSVKD